MATVYSGQRWNGEGSCYWRIRVDYSDNSANVYVDVGPSGWSIWLRFTSGNNTFTKMLLLIMLVIMEKVQIF